MAFQRVMDITGAVGNAYAGTIDQRNRYLGLLQSGFKSLSTFQSDSLKQESAQLARSGLKKLKSDEELSDAETAALKASLGYDLSDSLDDEMVQGARKALKKMRDGGVLDDHDMISMMSAMNFKYSDLIEAQEYQARSARHKNRTSGSSIPRTGSIPSFDEPVRPPPGVGGTITEADVYEVNASSLEDYERIKRRSN